MLGSIVDGWLMRRNTDAVALHDIGPFRARFVATPKGAVRLVDTGGDLPCVVMVPDGPNVIEHYAALLERLSPSLRVVCFDMPGFGFSVPSTRYEHTLDDGAGVVLGVLDQLRIERATLAFSCANGFYALRAARTAPARIASLFLSQTPSLDAMHGWVARNIPRPLRIPVVGQLASRVARKQLAHRWYGMALPRGADRESYRVPARQALEGGGCFSLAGVVQGLLASRQDDLRDVTVPCRMLWGEQDRSHRGTDPLSLRDCAANAGITTLPTCGHFPDLEQPDRFVELLLAQVTGLHE